MMTDYGFSKAKKTTMSHEHKLDLTGIQHTPKVKASSDNATELAKAGEQLGYVNRDPVKARRPGPKRKEPQDKLTINGPARVIQAFRALGEPNEALWETLEKLVNQAKES